MHYLSHAKMLFYIILSTFYISQGLLANEIDTGKQWLQTTIQNSSIFSTEQGELQNNLALRLQTAKESVIIFGMMESVPPLDEAKVSQAFTDNDDVDTIEYLTARLAIDKIYDNDMSEASTKLLTLQNKNGGFGYARGYNSTVLDTALGLEGLWVSEQSGEVVVNALQYIQQL